MPSVRYRGSQKEEEYMQKIYQWYSWSIQGFTISKWLSNTSFIFQLYILYIPAAIFLYVTCEILAWVWDWPKVKINWCGWPSRNNLIAEKKKLELSFLALRVRENPGNHTTSLSQRPPVSGNQLSLWMLGFKTDSTFPRFLAFLNDCNNFIAQVLTFHVCTLRKWSFLCFISVGHGKP